MILSLLAMIGATALLSSSGVLVKLADLPSPIMAWFRTCIPMTAIGAFFLISLILGSGRERLPGKPSRSLLLASGLNAVRLLFLFAGYRYTSVSSGIIIVYSWPVFAALFGAVILHERIGIQNAALLGVAFLGILLVYGEADLRLGDRNFVGMSLLLVNSLLYALSVVLFKSNSGRYKQLGITFYQNLIPVLLFTPMLPLYWDSPSLYSISIALAYGVFIGIVAFLLFFTALRHLSASMTAHLSYLELIGAMVLSVLILGESLSWNKILGGALILASVILVSARTARQS